MLAIAIIIGLVYFALNGAEIKSEILDKDSSSERGEGSYDDKEYMDFQAR